MNVQNEVPDYLFARIWAAPIVRRSFLHRTHFDRHFDQRIILGCARKKNLENEFFGLEIPS
ncbi:MAG TPA: hypothetical protein DEB60_10385 [Brevundimonas sp.]|nr:hypothetical protein [Brevundimonas sp.]